MTFQGNILVVSTPGGGKSLSAAADSLTDQAAVNIDPHENSMGREILTHATGNVLYDNCSDVEHALPYDLLEPSIHRDPRIRAAENHRRAEAFVQILIRRRDMAGLAATPLMEEFVMAAIMLYLFQSRKKPLSWLPFAFMPDTDQFRAMVRDCLLPDICHKFEQLAKLTYRGLRAEIGSAVRLISAVFQSPFFLARSRGGFDLGGFLQRSGKLIIERGGQIGDDAFRTIAGAVILLTIDHAKRRPKPFPIIRCRLDEAGNAGFTSATEIRAAAETRKYGLFFTFILQRIVDDLLQLCVRHEYFRCSEYDLAHKAAIDVAAGLRRSEDKTRAELIAELTDDIMNLEPGWRWVRDPKGSRKEYVPMVENPWPDWPGLREAKFQEKLRCLYSRPEYKTSDPRLLGDDETPPSSHSSPDTPPPPSSSPSSFSPAERWKRKSKKPADGSSNSGAESESK